MKALKIILIIIGILIAVPLLTALFVPKKYAVERDIEIDRPKDEVFAYIKHLRNQDHFSRWAKMDPNMKKEYRGKDGTVGFVSAWDSDNKEVGKGEQEIVNIVDGERIDFELRFLEPFEATEPAFMTTESTGPDETKVTWGFSGHMTYPMNIMLLFIDFEEMIGNDLETGLENLKKVLESGQETV